MFDPTLFRACRIAAPRTLAVVACSFLTVGAAFAQGTFERVGTAADTFVSAVAVAGDHVIYGSGGGLKIVDPSDPAWPREVSTLDLPARVQGIVVDGDLAYIAGDEAGVFVVDISSLSEPVAIHVIETPGQARAIALTEEYAFVAASGDLRAIRRGQDPQTVGVIDVPSSRDVAICGDIALVPGSEGVWLVNVSSPTDMTRFGRIPVWGNAVATDGELGFVGTENGELLIFDFKQPVPRFQVGSFRAADRIANLAVADDLVFLVADHYPSFDKRLHVIDVTNPTAPVEIGSVDLSRDYWDRFTDIALGDDRAYVRGEYRTLILDIVDPSNPVEVGALVSGFPQEIHVLDDLAIVELGDGFASWFSGIAIVDLSVPEAPAYLSFIDPNGACIDAAVAGTTLVVGRFDGVLEIYDISVPSLPMQVSALGFQCRINGVAISGDRVYVSDDCGIRVVDVSEPSNPVEVGFSATGRWDDYGTVLRVAGDRVFVGFWIIHPGLGSGGGFEVWDVSDPASPLFLDSVDSGFPSEFVVRGDRAYVLGTHSFWGGGSTTCGADISTYDLSTPSVPIELDRVEIAFVWFTGCGFYSSLSALNGGMVGSFDYDVFVFDEGSGLHYRHFAHQSIEDMESVGDYIVTAEYPRGLVVYAPAPPGQDRAADE